MQEALVRAERIAGEERGRIKEVGRRDAEEVAGRLGA